MDGLGVAIFLGSSLLSVIYPIVLFITIFMSLGGSRKCRNILLWVEAPQIVSVLLFLLGMHWQWWGYLDDSMLSIFVFSAAAMLLSLIVAILVSRWLGHPFHLWIICHIIFITLLWPIISCY